MASPTPRFDPFLIHRSVINDLTDKVLSCEMSQDLGLESEVVCSSTLTDYGGLCQRPAVLSIQTCRDYVQAPVLSCIVYCMCPRDYQDQGFHRDTQSCLEICSGAVDFEQSVWGK